MMFLQRTERREKRHGRKQKRDGLWRNEKTIQNRADNIVQAGRRDQGLRILRQGRNKDKNVKRKDKREGRENRRTGNRDGGETERDHRGRLSRDDTDTELLIDRL